MSAVTISVRDEPMDRYNPTGFVLQVFSVDSGNPTRCAVFMSKETQDRFGRFKGSLAEFTVNVERRFTGERLDSYRNIIRTIGELRL